MHTWHVHLVVSEIEYASQIREITTYFRDKPLISLLDRFFIPLLIDKIDQSLISIRIDLLLQMASHDISLEPTPTQVDKASYQPFLSTSPHRIQKLTVSCKSMICKSGLYLNVLISAQNTGTLPRIWTKLNLATTFVSPRPGVGLSSRMICSVSLKLATRPSLSIPRRK